MQEEKRAARAGTRVGPNNNANTHRKIALSGWTERHFFLAQGKNGSEEYYDRPVDDGRIFFLVMRIGPWEYCYAGWGAHPATPPYWRQRHMPPGKDWDWDGQDGAWMLFRRRVGGG